MELSAVRVLCECGAQLGLLNVPYSGEEDSFRAVCPGCGTRYRRPIAALLSRAEPQRTVTVVLPRARPRG